MFLCCKITPILHGIFYFMWFRLSRLRMVRNFQRKHLRIAVYLKFPVFYKFPKCSKYQRTNSKNGARNRSPSVLPGPIFLARLLFHGTQEAWEERRQRLWEARTSLRDLQSGEAASADPNAGDLALGCSPGKSPSLGCACLRGRLPSSKPSGVVSDALG